MVNAYEQSLTDNGWTNCNEVFVALVLALLLVANAQRFVAL